MADLRRRGLCKRSIGICLSLSAGQTVSPAGTEGRFDSWSTRFRTEFGSESPSSSLGFLLLGGGTLLLPGVAAFFLTSHICSHPASAGCTFVSLPTETEGGEGSGWTVRRVAGCRGWTSLDRTCSPRSPRGRSTEGPRDRQA